MFADICTGLISILTPETIGAVALGIFTGLMFGAIPGISGIMAISILLPLTFYVSPLVGIPMLLGIYKASMFGGSITAVLLNTPGAPPAVCTAMDGYPLTKQGKAGKGLNAALVGSVFGDTFSNILLICVAAPLSYLTLKVGPVEQCSLILLALTVVGSISGSSILKGILCAGVGILLATVGVSGTTGAMRFTFENENLMSGIALIPMVIGLLCLPEVIHQACSGIRKTFEQQFDLSGENGRLSWQEIKSRIPVLLRSSIIGSVIGGAAVVFTLLSAVLFVVMVGFARSISVLMQAPAEAVALTASYVRICGSGIFFIVAYNLLAAVFRGLGDSKSPLLFVLVACVVNIIGDLVLVAGFHLDAAGAAIATVAAQAVSVVCAVVILLKKKLPFTIRKSDFRLNLQSRKFLSIGLPLALQEFLTQLSFLALCAFVNRLGLEASSGYGVACKIVNFAMLIPSSLMQSMASFVSQNMGAGNPKRAKKAMFTGIGIGLAFGCAMFALVFFRGDLLSNVFTTDAAVIQNAFAYLKGFAPETLATAVLFSMVGYFNGSDKTVWVMVQGLVQTLLVRLPMAYIMSIQPNANLTMIGLAAPTSTVVGIVLNVCFFLALERRSKKAAV